MPPSKVKPEDTYEAFNSNETFTAVARRFGVVRLTLKRWWIRHFGEEAFQRKVTREKRTPEQRRKAQQAYKARNRKHISKVSREWRLKNPDKVRSMRRTHSTLHREQHREYWQRYYSENAERLRATAREYRAQNLENMRKKERDYYISKPATLLLKCAKQRARRFNVPFDLTLADVQSCIPANNICPITKVSFRRGEGKVGPTSMTLDRIDPEKGYVRGNVAVISHLANTMKQNCSDPAIFRRLADYIERKPTRCP